MSRFTPHLLAFLAVLALLPATSTGQDSTPAPTNLTAVVLSSSSIQLSWNGTLSNGTYRIERSLDGATFAEIASTKDNVKTYTDNGLLDDFPYAYRVRARKGSNNSDYSNIASATTRIANAWRTPGGHSPHTGKNAVESGTAPLTPAWTRDLNPPGAFTVFSVAPLVIEGDRAYTTMSPNSSPDYPSMLWSLDLATGQIRWVKDFAFANVLNASVRHGRVFVSRDQGSGTPGQLDAYNASNGSLLWSTVVGPQVNDVTPAANHGLFMQLGSSGGVGGGGGGIGGIGSGSLLRFNAVTGQQVYANTTLEGTGPLAAYANGSVFTYAVGKVRGHDAATGATQWTVVINAAPISGGSGVPVVGGGLVYVTCQRSVYAVNPATQSIAWVQSGYTVQDITPAYADGVLYVNNAGSILALDGATGAPLWSFTDSLNIEYPPVVVNNHLFLATRNDLFAVNLGTRQTVYSERNIWAGPLAVAQGKLLVAGIDGVVKAYTLSPGTLPNQATPPAAPQSLAAAGKGTGGVRLTWTDASSTEAGFRVERSTDAGATYPLLTTLGAGAVEFLDTGLVNPQSYQYRVRAFNDAGTSAASNSVTFAPPAPGNSWNMLGLNPQHTGFNAKEAARTATALAWSWPSGSSLTPAVVEDGRVFTTSRPGFSPVLTSLDAASGAVLWSQSFEAGGSGYGPASVVNGRVYVTFVNEPNSKLICAEASTGRVLWATPYFDAGFTTGSPTIANGTAFVAGGLSGSNWLYSFNAIDGRQNWVRPGAFSAGVVGTTIYSHWQDQFQAVDPATGNALWTTPMATGSIPTLTATRGYGVTNRDLFAINLTNHAVVGTVASGNLNNFYAEPSVQGGNLYWVTDGTLQVRRESDLALQWSFAGDGQLRTRPVIAGGHVYVSSLDNTYVLRIQTRSLAATLPGGGEVTVAAGKLFVAGLDGELRAYRLQ